MNVCRDVILVMGKYQCHVNDRMLLFFPALVWDGVPNTKDRPHPISFGIDGYSPFRGDFDKVSRHTTDRWTIRCSVKWDPVQCEVGSCAV